VTALGEAGLDDWVLEFVAGNGFIPGVRRPDQVRDPDDPCDGAVPRIHSHFFMEDGMFGSLNWKGDQVDDGTYVITDDGTFIVSKESPDVTFNYTIEDDTISFDPVIPDCSPKCFEAAWSVSVAYPARRGLAPPPDPFRPTTAPPTLIRLSFPRPTLWAMRVLVVEDEVKMAGLLKRALEEEGYAVDVAGRGQDAVWLGTENPYDAIVLDLMLPDLDGFEVSRQLREAGRWSPVLMLTARDAVADRVAGLDAGADDYLTKPFSFAELLARLRALMRRGAAERPPVLRTGDLELDPAARSVARNGTPIALTAREFSLLEYLMRHSGEVLTRTQLIEHVWDFAYDGDSNVVDVYVRYLRNKVDRPFGRDQIETVRGAGYRLRDEPL